MPKNKPFVGSTADWVVGSATITGNFPNRLQRRQEEKFFKAIKAQYMRPTSKNIIIQALLDQKQGVTMFREDGSAMKLLFVPNREKYETNGLVTNPVVATVKVANPNVPWIQKDHSIIMHHNTIFNKESTIEIDENKEVKLLSIAVDRWIMGHIDDDGEIIPYPENVVCKRIKASDVPADDFFIMPDNAVKDLRDKVVVLSAPEGSPYKPGDEIVIKKWADYQVFYNWGTEERDRIVVWVEDIEGYIPKY